MSTEEHSAFCPDCGHIGVVLLDGSRRCLNCGGVWGEPSTPIQVQSDPHADFAARMRARRGEKPAERFEWKQRAYGNLKKEQR